MCTYLYNIEIDKEMSIVYNSYPMYNSTHISMQ